MENHHRLVVLEDFETTPVIVNMDQIQYAKEINGNYWVHFINNENAIGAAKLTEKQFRLLCKIIAEENLP